MGCECERVRGELVVGRLRVTRLNELGILERYGVATHGRTLGTSKGARHPVIPWQRIVHVVSEVVIRD